jgi:hypothetical protein
MYENISKMWGLGLSCPKLLVLKMLPPWDFTLHFIFVCTWHQIFNPLMIDHKKKPDQTSKVT